jgi:uncharacterized RDD family membrane protein YckC
VSLISRRRQTVCKKLLAIQVVDLEATVPLHFWCFVLRRYSILLHLPIIAVIDVFASMVETLFIFRVDRRGIHKLVAGTKIVIAPRNT